MTIPLFFPDAEARRMALGDIGPIEGGNRTLTRLAGQVIKTESKRKS